MAFTTDLQFDFIGKRWYAIAASTLVIVVGLALIVVRGGLPLGIDFSGGTLIVVRFAQPTTEDTVREALASIEGDKVVQQYGGVGANEMLIRLPLIGEDTGTRLEENADVVISTLEASEVGAFEVISRDLVGPVIGDELQQRGINAFVFAMFGILVYVGMRFRPSFGVGAIVAVIHDILITVSLLTVFGYELSLNVVAAMLTITGYSVNDTIVVFDRVRENLRSMRRDQFEPLVNASINQTLGRTIITSGTTVFAVLALFLFGGEVLRGFAFTMLVGVITGTYSTIFIASAVAILITQQRAARRRRQDGGAVGSGSPAATPRSKRRRARAS